MGTIRTSVAFIVLGLALASPAQAADPVALPEPSGITLFTLGLAGLLIGRRIAAKRRRD